jgi:hypothetical protein
MTQKAEALFTSGGDQMYHASHLSELSDLIAWMGRKVTPVLQWTGHPGVRMLHRRGDHRDIFLLANPGLVDAPGALSIQIEGQVSIWDAEDGSIEPLGKLRPGETLEMRIPAESARFVVFE